MIKNKLKYTLKKLLNANKTFDVIMFNDGRMIVQTRKCVPPQPPKKSVVKHVPSRMDNSTRNKHMTIKNYNKTIKRNCKKFYKLNYPYHYYSVTLTLKSSMTYNEINSQFNRFIQNLRRKFQSVNYMRVIEIQKGTGNYHIHALLEFIDNPKKLNSDLISHYWGKGFCTLKREKNPYRAIQYMTLNNEMDLIETKCDYLGENLRLNTPFNRSARIITKSKSFGEQTQGEYKVISSKELATFIADLNTQGYFVDNNGNFIRIDSHFYDKGLCIDRIYFHPQK